MLDFENRMMGQYDALVDQSLQLFVWREVCRHLELRESATTIAEMLHRELGALGIRIDRLGDTGIDTLFESPRLTTPTVFELDDRLKRSLFTWAKRDGFTLMDDAASGPSIGPLRSLLTPPRDAKVSIGPLLNESRLIGLLHVYWKQNVAPELVQRAAWILEPLAAALENDARLHQLESLRAAAEAERNRLLSRYGRKPALDDEVVGADAGLRWVMERVALVAGLDVPVLILGETGTGKEVISRAIHNRSRRASGPFIRVNCGAIPSELIDSQLFGHEKGSFTGASDQRQGWFERADGGTLFLDEIGELPLAAQVRLLRVLQDHQIERVGGKESIHVDVRIIAATHRDLSTMVKQQMFREDLWYRVNVFPILMPRLRDRIEDIAALTNHFAQRAASRFGLPVCEPTAADLQLLSSYPWPGNVRELGAVIDRAAILGNGQTLEIGKALGFGQPSPAEPSGIPTPMHQVAQPIEPPVGLPSLGIQPAGFNSPFPISPTAGGVARLDSAMVEHIERALAASGGRIEGNRGAAEILGINPHTLRARMRKLGIDWNRFRNR